MSAKNFDPWTASFDESVAAMPESEPAINPSAPLYQWAAAQDINARRGEIEAGGGFAVLACIRDCVTHGLVAPEWLAHAFNRRYDAVRNFRAKSWDDPEAFGKPHPKGTQLAAERKRLLRSFQVWLKARAILQKEPETPIDDAFFERIGREIIPPCGKTEASEIYYLMKKTLEKA